MKTINQTALAVLVTTAAIVACGGGKMKQGGPSTDTQAQGRYASVNGLNLYYEIHGSGEPLILLHGGVGASEMFGPILPPLAERRRVIAVHLQGHGRTADIDRPQRALLHALSSRWTQLHLGIEKADLVGYSLGGGVALRTAIQHPEVVRRLVLISTPFKRDGFYPEVLAAMQLGPAAAEGMKQSPLSQLYPRVDWRVLFTKLGDLLRRDYDWSRDVAAMKAPTMLVFADADAIRPRTSWNSTDCSAAGRRTRAWTVPEGLRHSSPFCPAARTTTSFPPPCWRRSLWHSSTRPRGRPNDVRRTAAAR